MAADRMMINDQLILVEAHDENYQPLDEEIFAYAITIGIDPDKETQLLWIAREGINAPLPSNWKPCQDPEGHLYFFNFTTGDSSWDHPCDDFYRKMAIDERRKPKPNSQLSQKTMKAKPQKEAMHSTNKMDNVAIQVTVSQSAGVPTMHLGGPMSTQAVKSAPSLAPLRKPSKQEVQRSSGSLHSFPSALTSSLSLPIYSNEYDFSSDERLVVNLHDVASIGYAESIESDNLETESSSEDYAKDVDFGIDKNLSERILDIDMLEPAVRGSLEKDFLETSLSMKSTARDESSPVMREERSKVNERLKMAEMAAAAADKRLLSQATNADFTQIAPLQDKELSDMKEKLNRELESAKLDLLEEKDRKLKKLRGEVEKERTEKENSILKEKEDIIRNLRAQVKEDTEYERETLEQQQKDTMAVLKARLNGERDVEEERIRKEAKEGVEGLMKEVEDLRGEEREKLEREKARLLEEIRVKVEDAVVEEKERLEEDRIREKGDLKVKFEQELKAMKHELSTQHQKRVDSLRAELDSGHEQELVKMQRERSVMNQEELLRESRELDSLKQKQKTVSEFDAGLEDILQQRKQELKVAHEKELNELRKAQDVQLNALRGELKERERKEKQSISANIANETEKFKRDLRVELEGLLKKHREKKTSLQEKLEEEDEDMMDREEDLQRRQTEAEVTRRDIEEGERKLEERQRSLKAEWHEFDRQKEEAYSKRSGFLEESERERYCVERKQMTDELNQEQATLDNVKKEKRDLQAEIEKLKLNHDNMTKKIRRLTKDYDIRLSDFTKLQDTLKMDDLCVQEVNGDLEGQPVVTETERVKMVKIKLSDDDGSKQRHLQEELLADVEDAHSPPLVRHLATSYSVIRDQITQETSSILKAKQFLRHQRQSVKRRQVALQTARTHLHDDSIKHMTNDVGVENDAFMEDIRRSLDLEGRDLDEITNQVNRGKRLVRDKETTLNQISNSLSDELDSDSEEWNAFDTKKRTFQPPDLDLSEDDLSVMEPSHHTHTTAGVDVNLHFNHNDPLADSLHKINAELSHVLTFMKHDLGAPTRAGQRNNPYHHVTTTDFIDAELSLEKKWHKYFGDKKVSISSPVGFRFSANLFGSSAVKSELDKLRGDLRKSRMAGLSSQRRLDLDNEWLKSPATANTSAPTQTDVAHTSNESPPVTAPSPTPPFVEERDYRVRLELDNNDEIRVCHY